MLTKRDVYSFGIILLELLTGKKPTDPMFHGGLNLHNFALNALPGRVMDIIDPVILPEVIRNDASQTDRTNMTSTNYNDNQMEECMITMFNIGVKCTMESPQVRPDICDVLRVLESVRIIFKAKKSFVEKYLSYSSKAAVLIAQTKKKEQMYRRKREKPYSRLISMFLSLNVSYEDLHKATNGFSSTNLVGAGGFGSVYKGIFDQAYVRFALKYNGIRDGDETAVAVKVFNLQRRGAANSFVAECKALGNIRYRNIVKIITTCTSIDEEGQNFRAIVYEFMEHGSLERWLHSTKKTSYHDGHDKPQILNLRTRINIAIDVASALNHLHHQCENPIIHCDLKPSNILLDRNMLAHVADFGLSTFLPESPKSDRSCSIGLRGTVGYIAPEYGLGSVMSTKGDVYSFGILLLEMLIGKKPTNRMFHGGVNLHNFAWIALPGRVMDIIDPVLKKTASFNEENSNQMVGCLTQLFNIGVTCSKPSPHNRPDMSDVLRELKSVKENLKEI